MHNTLDALKALVCSFDDEEGLPEQSFNATKVLIRHIMGEAPSKVFSHYIEATDGRFYQRDKDFAANCWKDMLDAIGK